MAAPIMASTAASPILSQVVVKPMLAPQTTAQAPMQSVAKTRTATLMTAPMAASSMPLYTMPATSVPAPRATASTQGTTHSYTRGVATSFPVQRVVSSMPARVVQVARPMAPSASAVAASPSGVMSSFAIRSVGQAVQQQLQPQSPQTEQSQLSSMLSSSQSYQGTTPGGFQPQLWSDAFTAASSTYLGNYVPQMPPPTAFYTMPPSNMVLSTCAPPRGPCRLRREPEDAPLGAVIVTIAEGGSYDRIFQDVPQLGEGGTAVVTYTATFSDLEKIKRRLERGAGSRRFPAAEEADGDLEQLAQDMGEVDKESVLFNWECCSGCSGHHPNVGTFGRATAVTMQLTRLLLDRGHMVMFSDFSLKALIQEWDEALLGPNPFEQLGTCMGRLKLRFDPAELLVCPSSQLSKVGNLCEEGSADLHAIADTIVFGVVQAHADAARAAGHYELQQLTRAQAEGREDETAGHVLLTYAQSGGRLLTSAGHWMELSNLGGVSEERLIQAAVQSYGMQYAESIRVQLASCTDTASRQQVSQSLAQQYVQQSAPCSYSSYGN
eukprot:TRINITY_DN56987_c0_g1_i1.p1 TRINITY_DN56987_c0_g1~~TRINITY_DN56987_c0_g1_i1.p1  ORF type:complete len:551 (-),score=78.29 TRINITY_DN56987_c0_g1_i1:59-1711(-)